MVRTRLLIVVAALWCGAALPAAPGETTPCSENAALRYWMAFALMENPAVGSELANRLEQVAQGLEPWHESLAPVVERNRQAIETMHRGSRFATCNWGFEHELLADAPIAHLSRARALARLNVLYGMRLMDAGKRAEAVDAWLAGIRFSAHVAADSPWVGALVAGGGLKAHVRALAAAVGRARLDPATLRRIEGAIAVLPEAGFDWSVPAKHEAEAMSGLASAIEEADDPVAMLQTYFSDDDRSGDREEIARMLGLTVSQLSSRAVVQAAVRRARTANDALAPKVVAAFRLSYEDAALRAREIDAHVAQDPALSKMWPSLARFNEARGDLAAARAELLGLLRRAP